MNSGTVMLAALVATVGKILTTVGDMVVLPEANTQGRDRQMKWTVVMVAVLVVVIVVAVAAASSHCFLSPGCQTCLSLRSCFLAMVTIVLMRVMLCDDGDDKNDVAQEMITPSCPWIVAIRMNTNILSSCCCGCFPWSNVAVIVVGVCITVAGNKDKVSV